MKASSTRSKVVVAHGPCGGGKGKQVVDCRGNFERAFVAVAFDAVDPFRVDDAATAQRGRFHHQACGSRAFGAGMVVVIDWAVLPLQVLIAAAAPPSNW